MKFNIKYLSIAVLVSLAFTSCSDFLDDKPFSDLTNENLGVGFGGDSLKYTTAVQAEQLLTAAYAEFGSEYWSLDVYLMNEAQTDNAYAGESKEQTTQIDRIKLSPTNGTVARDWGYLYSHISKANVIINWVPQITDVALTETRRNEIVAEAKFMRALAHFNLVRIYGSVPLVTKDIPEISIDIIDEIYPLLYPEQAPVDSIYSQIIEDLEYALDYVSDYSATKFKITKAFVNLLLAEVYATKDGFENTDWAKVKQYANAVVSDSRYGLMSNYDDLFAVADGLNNGVLPYLDLLHENNKESIFEVDYNSWNTLGNWAGQMFVGVDWKKFNTPSKDLYNAFSREGDDVRRDASILFYDVSGKWTDFYWPSAQYPFSWKIRAQEKNNLILYRYAEAVLLLADAENELGNLPAAQTQLNKVRNRVGLGNTTAGTKDAMRRAIEEEYRFEFAFEGKRWFDLKRRGRFIEVMKSCTDHQKEYGASMTENRLLWPIPQKELDLNENLKQNTGY